MGEQEQTHFLGIDYGEKVIGLSTYKLQADPFPLMYGRLVVKNDDVSLIELKSIIDTEFIDHVILGLPFLTDGNESSMTKKVRHFGELLQKKIGETPLSFQDETLSTYEAEERMKNDPRFDFKVDPKKIDALSAVIIIESYLSERKK